ncbi:hypothetical protein N431DRAFT_439197 [Stipitochalara longipes BDJ]|nr:hypothetical protein N431DRAFT_439197 [Stipitochalara longipes BDJ]
MHALGLALWAPPRPPGLLVWRPFAASFAAGRPQDGHRTGRPQERRQRLAALSRAVLLQAAAMHGLARRCARRSW